MPLERHLFPEWRDENLDSLYPFSDAATLTAQSGLKITPDLFLDASLYPIGAQARLHLSRIKIETRLVTMTIGEPKKAVLATATFDPLDPPNILRFEDVNGRPAGLLVSEEERLAIFQAWPLGEHRFGATATEFCASCVSPMPQVGVQGILLESGEVLTGDVWILGEEGVVVRSDEDGVIRVDIVGDPLFRRKLCEPTSVFRTPRFIKTINDVAPDEHGELSITVGGNSAGDTILRIYPHEDGLKIEAIGQKTRT